jgi:uncharacterized membrane protein
MNSKEAFLTRDSVLMHPYVTSFAYSRVSHRLYISGLNVIFEGLQLQQYMQFHPGLRIYATLIGDAMVYLKDFGAYFLYLVLGLGFGSMALAMASGGNVDFVTLSGAISGILRMTFGYYDYDEFIANYQGVGSFGATSDIWYVLGTACTLWLRVPTQYVRRCISHVYCTRRRDTYN